MNLLIVLFCAYGSTFSNQINLRNVRVVTSPAASEKQDYDSSGEEDLDIIEFDTEGEEINMEEHKMDPLLEKLHIYLVSPFISFYNWLHQDS